MIRMITAAAMVAVAAIGCGSSDNPGDPSGAGAGGTGGSAEVGGMGGGGADPCPTGSHDVDGACEANLGPFAETSPIASARDHHVTWAAERPGGRFLYVAGGAVDMTSAVTTIERSRIGDDGSLGAWEVLPIGLTAVGHMVVSTDTRVFFAGGQRAGGVSTNSEGATIGDDGSLGALQPGPVMNVARFHGAAVLHGEWIYAVGGIDAEGTSSALVERLAFNDGGPQGPWLLESEAMPEPRSHHGLAVSDEGTLYVTGGLTRIMNDFGNDTPYDTVLASDIQADGSIGPWTEVGSLPFPLAVHASFVHAGQLYVVSGLDMSTSQFVGTIMRAPLLEGGGLGSWETLPSELPITRGHCHQTPMVNGWLYSVAGTNNLGSQTNAFMALFE